MKEVADSVVATADKVAVARVADAILTVAAAEEAKEIKERLKQLRLV